MDISDILAEATNNVPIRSDEVTDHIALTRAWINERNSPELLPWPAQLMDRIMERLRVQIQQVENSFGDIDPAGNFKSIVIQTELERFKYLIRSLLRTRVAKIDAHALHYLSSPEYTSRLSTSELSYAKSHQASISSHYNSSFMSQFPANLQKLDDTAGGISMVEQPDSDKAVFVRVLRGSDEEISVEGTDIDFTLEEGNVMVIRWSAVKEIVERGGAELI